MIRNNGSKAFDVKLTLKNGEAVLLDINFVDIENKERSRKIEITPNFSEEDIKFIKSFVLSLQKLVDKKNYMPNGSITSKCDSFLSFKNDLFKDGDHISKIFELKEVKQLFDFIDLSLDKKGEKFTIYHSLLGDIRELSTDKGKNRPLVEGEPSTKIFLNYLEECGQFVGYKKNYFPL